MPGSTTELNLSTAVDSDDNADYLTINLANSLRTVDALFNNVTGHTHSGAHNGGPVAPAAGSITSAMIADGTIATADLANASVTNAKLGPDVARANLLTNGGFEIWQRGNGPFVNAGGGVRGPDRWTLLGATNLLSVSRDSANADSGSQFCAACTVSAGVSSGNPADFSQTFQSSDGSYGALRGTTVTASIRVKCSVANAVHLRLTVDGGTSYAGGYHSGSGNYETLTVTLAVPLTPSSPIVWLRVFFEAACTAYLDNAMLVVGSQPADYVPLHPADDLARCLRYYEVWDGINDGPSILSAATAAGQNIGSHFQFKAIKAVTPTITKVGTWGITTNCGQPIVGSAGTKGVQLYTASTAAGQIQCQPSGAGQGLVVESNPLFIPMGFLMMQGAEPNYVVYGLALVAMWMMSMDAKRTADLARQLGQFPGLNRLIDRLRSPATAIRAVAFRMLRPVLT